MIIVMPMAGRGKRFVETGVLTPKPLIPVLGRPMYTWAMESLPLQHARRVIFVCLQDHLKHHGLREDILARYGHLNPVIVPLSDVTEGQACTVLLARHAIDETLPLLIYNSDTYGPCEHIPASCDGFLGVFEAEGTHWSFARTDATGKVVETAEKRRISNLASTGLYYFTRASDFLTHADAMIADNERVNNEFYVAPIYNRMIQQGANIRVEKVHRFHALGTPNELAAFVAQRKAHENRAGGRSPS